MADGHGLASRRIKGTHYRSKELFCLLSRADDRALVWCDRHVDKGMPELPWPLWSDREAFFVQTIVVEEQVEDWLDEEVVGFERDVYQCHMGVLIPVSVALCKLRGAG